MIQCVLMVIWKLFDCDLTVIYSWSNFNQIKTWLNFIMMLFWSYGDLILIWSWHDRELIMILFWSDVDQVVVWLWFDSDLICWSPNKDGMNKKYIEFCSLSMQSFATRQISRERWNENNDNHLKEQRVTININLRHQIRDLRLPF